MSTEKKYLEINNRKVEIGDEKNLLELIRKSNITIPTFCYHSELSIYGACRLCVVDIEGWGIQASCSIVPKEGMKVKTHTQEIRDMRKISLELLLANHDKSCPTCDRSDSCKLHDLSAQLGIEEVRFKKAPLDKPLDKSSNCLVRDPNKCVLCGDCVRYCKEIQGIGAIDFAYRGSDAEVMPAFGHGLGDVECVDCGGCATVCPTGAIVPRSQVNPVWKELDNSEKEVVVQVAPAVRVALGEMFNIEAGKITTGKMIAALRMLGFDKVYDTSFSADLTVIEEAHEFLARKEKGEKLPIFTSCCPSWVQYVEQYHPDLIPNLSSCKSPQQMLGALLKKNFESTEPKSEKELVVVSIMPCTSKKGEALREEHANGDVRDVDYVLTTKELGRMIKEAGIDFNNLEDSTMDTPFGFATGAGVLFGNSGGVTEAVLRYAASIADPDSEGKVNVQAVRDCPGITISDVEVGGNTLKLGVVHGLKNAGKIAKQIENKELELDLVEVMSCPKGCIGGAGQPIPQTPDCLEKRKQGIFKVDRILNLKDSSKNPYVTDLYTHLLKEANSEKAHQLLHTHYHGRKRINDDGVQILAATSEEAVTVKVCVGTSCHLKGAQDVLQQLLHHIKENQLEDTIQVEATFCMEKCDRGPSVTVGKKVIHQATLKTITDEIKNQLN